MPAVAVPTFISKAAFSQPELNAWRAGSNIKIVSRVEETIVAATPDFTFVEASTVFGLGIDWIQALAIAAGAGIPVLSLLLERSGATSQTLSLSLLPDNVSVFHKFRDPLLIDKNVKVTFRVTGLADADKYSIFASVFQWRPQGPPAAALPGV